MSKTLRSEEYDVVVMGAGFAGLISAHRYLCLQPTASLTILDRNTHVGGNWSFDRIYPNFYAQFVTGLAEFSDMNMREPPKDDCVADCFKAECMAKYLEEFADEMIHDGKSLSDRVRQVEVVEVTKDVNVGDEQQKWKIQCRDVRSKEHKGKRKVPEKGTFDDASKLQDPGIHTITAQILIVATGYFSTPNIPQFPHQSTFSAPIIHSNNFGASNILATPGIRHVAVLGAGKSSADMLYCCLKSLPPDAQIHWIIREGGTGPGYFAPVDLNWKSPYKNFVEAANTMGMSMLQPSVLHKDGWCIWLLHQTWIGVWLLGWLFKQIDVDAKRRAGYTTRRGECQDRGFHKLEYNPGIFWMSGPGGALHHNDFWDLVASRVIVQRASIERMSSHILHLSNDTQVQCDALLLGTGWTSSLSIFSEEVKAELGLPHHPDIDSPETTSAWEDLEVEADKTIIARFPMLSKPPPHYLKKPETTPYRLYRGIIPIHDPSRSIVFINFALAGNLIMNAETQAMWAVAYLNSSNSLCLPSPEDMQREIAARIAWCKRRYLSVGQLGNYFGFDGILYKTLLLEDLGVDDPWREKGMWGVRRPEDLGKAWEMFVERQVR